MDIPKRQEKLMAWIRSRGGVPVWSTTRRDGCHLTCFAFNDGAAIVQTYENGGWDLFVTPSPSGETDKVLQAAEEILSKETL